jgi:hypothetical protein
MKDRLAILIPNYNGGKLLRDSVSSCSLAGLDPTKYEIIVVDNCSTDNSVDGLASHDSAGACVRVVRNSKNIGRVGNWNRALDIARQEGFGFATLLFIGDTWLPGGSLSELLDLMKTSNAVMGMGPVVITSEDGSVLRAGKRVSIRQPIQVVESQALLRRVLQVGHLPFAPIQANVYRLFDEEPLSFDDGNPLITDLQGTFRFLLSHHGPVAITSRPFFAWRRHSQRFFLSAKVMDSVIANTQLLEEFSAATRIQVNWRSANAILLLTGSHGPLFLPIPWRERISIFRDVVRYIGSRPGGIGWSDMASILYRKLVWRQSFVSM